MDTLDFASPALADGPAATWKYMPHVDCWVWLPPLEPVDATLDTVRQWTQAGYQRMTPASQETFSLFAQLRRSLVLRIPGRAELEQWAHADDIAAAQRMPVALAFKLPEDAQQTLLPTVPDTLPIAVPLPPPQFGEMALVDDGKEWVPYTLSAVGGDGGLDLWRRMGTKLKALAAPAEWWLYTPLIEVCSHVGGYERARSDLNSQLLATRGEAREQVRAQLQALDAARKQVRAIERWKARVQRDAEQLRADWREVQAMAQQLAALYWAAHQQASREAGSAPSVAAIDEDLEELPGAVVGLEDPEHAADLTLVESVNTVSSAQDMLLTNYLEDEAVRHAAFRAGQRHEWSQDSGMYRYKHKSLGVYLGDPEHPMPLEEALARLRNISESTVLTMRIAMGLWNIRRYDGQLLKNGAAPMPIDEILLWRGVKKHSRLAYPQQGESPASEQRRTDGWNTKHVAAVVDDFALAELFYVHGSHDIWKNGKRVGSYEVSSPYMRATPVKRKDLWGHEEVVGMFVSPGDWIVSYAENGNYFLTPADRRVFQLNPQNEQHELRIALYLVELWRKQAKDRAYSEPIVMSDLLRESVIAVNEKNLTNRFAPRIEEALANLQRRGIIGRCECLTPVDKNKAHWGKDWLAARWRILPPQDVIDALEQIVRSSGDGPKALPKPGRKRQ